MSDAKAQIYKEVPPGGWDTHFHIFETDKFPLADGRHFTPSPATFEQLIDFEKSIGVDRFCIAHGLSFGTDCSSLLHYLDRFNGRARGICVLDIHNVTDETLDRYHAAGVRSVRIDFFREKAMDSLDKQIDLIQVTAARLVKWGKHRWIVQIQQPHLNHWHKLAPVIADLPVPVVVDHLALIQASSMTSGSSGSDPRDQDGFNELLDSLKQGNLWIKISAPYRCSDKSPQYDDLEETIQALVKANKHRTLWGSDWPHTQRHKDRAKAAVGSLETYLDIDDAGWIRTLSQWLTADEWQRMWVDNPMALYD